MAPTGTALATGSVEQESPLTNAMALENNQRVQAKKTWRFWAIFPALMLTSMLAAVESTVTSTALPYIVHELDAGDLYLWFINAYFLTSAAFLPLLGQLSDIFGRRWVFISVVAIFTLGSGLSGGARNAETLIAGRAIQGIGGGGINLFIELVISDLVPLRERGYYVSLIFAVFTLGTAIGPFVGGIIVDRSSWRWVFYINLPIGGAALILLLLFLKVDHDRSSSVSSRLKRIDLVGNVILIAAVASVLIALSTAGTRYSWSDYHVLVPLILGVAGLVLFHLYETAPWVSQPTLPEQIFQKRTPASALIITFLNYMLLFWAIYFLPVYFQAVLRASSTQSGVWLLPTVLVEVPVSVIGGLIVSKTGRYRPLHFLAFALMLFGFGMFAHFDRNTSTVEWVIVQMIPAVGVGLMMSTTLTAVQADLPEKDVAAATAAFAFMRAYGSIWGVAIPSAIFNSRFAAEAYRITDESIREQLDNGRAYSFVTASLLDSFDALPRDQVIDVFTQALKLTWLVSIAFSAAGLLLVFGEREIALRTDLQTEYGLQDHIDKQSTDEKGDTEATGGASK